jgi:hypothetical protein
MQIIERMLYFTQLVGRLDLMRQAVFLIKISNNILSSLIGELLHKVVHSVDSNPPEGRFLIVSMIGFLNEADRLKHVRDVIQPSYLGLKFLGFFNAQNVRSQQHLLVLLGHF